MMRPKPTALGKFLLAVGGGAMLIAGSMLCARANSNQLPPIPGVPRVGYTPVPTAPPAWWAEAIIPVD